MADALTSHLLMFTGTECDHCHDMHPLVEKLEGELGVKVQQLEVWHDAENAKFLEELDAGKCGGIPFFWNTKTEKWICGNCEYDQLKEWAGGSAASA
jgi:thiol-disulfide isomerase/thioredoxin